MKKIVLFAAIAAATFTFSSCNSCGNKKQQIVIENALETDSIYMVNDSTVADEQTFVFEGLMPMDNGTVGNVVLTIRALNLSDNGEYMINNTFMNGTTPMTWSDSGETVVLIGMPNDSTAMIYEFISENNNPKMTMKVNSDSSLTRLNNKMEPMSKEHAHRLIHRKHK